MLRSKIPQAQAIVAEAYNGMPFVKICGIMQPEHALVATEVGADMIGMVFAESRRQVSVETATRIADAVRSAERKPMLAGVFVNEAPEQMMEIAETVGLDVLQLSGDEPTEMAKKCMAHYPVIKAVRFPAGTGRGEVLEMLGEYRRKTSPDIRFLIDAHQPGAYGGTGTTADWKLVAQLVKQYRIMLAGGLNPANVTEAIETVVPWGVDVSSGVERDGVKDIELIKAFIVAAKNKAEKGIE
jgi:phosphoribosylanthranilate isomerase